MKPVLIESSSKMDELLKQLSNVKTIAVDTEFFRETTYYPQLALVQIATDTIVACIDPLAFDAKPALKKILLDESICKIFHSCSQDLEVLFYYLGQIPHAIYDTQIAYALLTKHPQIGYASLVENELSKQLDKSQTRTNWLQRPLTKDQLQYAGDDVLYLYQLHNKLDEKLNLKGRKAWFNEDCSKLSNNENSFQVETDKLWRRVKGAIKLNRNRLAIVQSMAQWREQLAQLKDKTRRKVLSDDIIIQLALNPPESTDRLKQFISQKHKQQFKLSDKEQQQLFNAIKTAQLVPEDQWPDNRFNALDNQQKLLLKNLQQLVNAKAEELHISSTVICSRKDLENLIILHANKHEAQDESSLSKSCILHGWRFRCIGQQLIEALQEADNMIKKTVV